MINKQVFNSIFIDSNVINMYLISIIMPIYNAEKYLKRTINSIINQTIGFDNIELILVDDNSSDSSKKIIEEFSDQFPNIVPFYSQVNHGFPGYGRNVGIKNASADYIMFIDNDDEYELDFCETIYNSIENLGCDVVSTNFSILEENIVTRVDSFSKFDSEVDSIHDYGKLIKLDKFKNISDVTIWTKIFRKDILWDNEILFVEDRLNEDSQFILNYYYYANDLVYIDYYGYKHHRDGENLSYFSSKSTLGFINSYYDLLKLVQEKYSDVDMVYLFRDRIELTIFRIMLSSHQKCLLEKLYDFEDKIEFNSPLNHFWATFCNKLILKRKFNFLIFLFKFLKVIKRFLDVLRSKKVI